MTDSRAADTVTSLLHAVDELDWDGVLAVLDGEVRLDYTSLWGGEVETVAAAKVVARWRGLLPGFDATQHLTGPVLVSSHPNADQAHCRTSVRAYHHVVDDGTWMIAGRYDIRVRRVDGGWRIAAITLRASYEDGDRSLIEIATKRCAAGSGGRADR